MKEQAKFDLNPKVPQPSRPTPGPWEYVWFEGFGMQMPRAEVGVNVLGAWNERQIVCTLHGEANARLIAAAPQMLETLYKVHNYLAWVDEHGDQDERIEILQAVEEAMAAARLWCEAGEGCSDDGYPVLGSEFCATCRPIHEPGYLLHKAGKCDPDCGRCALEAAMKEQAEAGNATE